MICCGHSIRTFGWIVCICYARDVKIALPYLRVENEVLEMKGIILKVQHFSQRDIDLLISMDIRDIFDDRDMKTMRDDQTLKLCSMLHKVSLETNDDGDLSQTPSEDEGLKSFFDPVVFRCDRPFITIVYDTESNLVLILGKITHPWNKNNVSTDR